jgi:hypothetical protein
LVLDRGVEALKTAPNVAKGYKPHADKRKRTGSAPALERAGTDLMI